MVELPFFSLYNGPKMSIIVSIVFISGTIYCPTYYDRLRNNNIHHMKTKMRPLMRMLPVPVGCVTSQLTLLILRINSYFTCPIQVVNRGKM